jgi:hypothetical protein
MLRHWVLLLLLRRRLLLLVVVGVVVCEYHGWIDETAIIVDVVCIHGMKLGEWLGGRGRWHTRVSGWGRVKQPWLRMLLRMLLRCVGWQHGGVIVVAAGACHVSVRRCVRRRLPLRLIRIGIGPPL